MGLYDKDKMQSEKTDPLESIEPGSYLGVIGKTYHYDGKKRSGVVTEIFLCNRYSEDGTVRVDLMKMHNAGGVMTVDFPKGKTENYITFGRILRHNNSDTLETDAVQTKNFIMANRIKFAKALGAWDDTSTTIQWEKIQALAGTVWTFNLVRSRDGQYTNLDLSSLLQMPNTKVPEDNLVRLYQIIEEQRAKEEAKKSAPVSAPPPPPDVPF